MLSCDNPTLTIVRGNQSTYPVRVTWYRGVQGIRYP